MALKSPCSSQGNQEQKKKEDCKKTNIKIRAALFFDGTNNNRYNTIVRLNQSKSVFKEVYTANTNEKHDTSYDNFYSNISFLSQFIDINDKNDKEDKVEYDAYFPIYIEGIGTETLKGDDKFGYGLGEGDTGIEAKVTSGINQMMSRIRGIAGAPRCELVIKKIRIDVFGFSRGAAAARHFVNEVLNSSKAMPGKRFPLKETLIKEKYDIKDVKIGYVGIFDTVASYGLSGTKMQWSNVSDLGLDAIKHNDVKKVCHIVSSDEHRKNFALTNIKSAEGKGKEIFLPGVHSDIGGSYKDEEKEKVFLHRTSIAEFTSTIEKEISNLIDEGWFTKSDLYYKKGNRLLYEYETLKDSISASGEVYVYRRGEDGVGIRNFYSRIPLHIMKENAMDSELAFTGIDMGDDTNLNKDNVPEIIFEAYATLRSYAKGPSSKSDWKVCSSMLAKLRRSHFHFSAQYGFTLGAYDPRYEGDIRTRKIHDG